MNTPATPPDRPPGAGLATPPRALGPGPASAKTGFGFRWVPIKSLEPEHRPGILGHLLALGERDRYLRFGYMASDTQIGRYVEQLDFERDEVFGIFNRRLELVAMAHLAYLGTGPDAPNPPHAEFGVSVAAAVRGRGYGERLFDHAALHARNRSIDTLMVHALSENTAMLKIVRNAGARIERDGPESQAWVRLAPDSLASHVEALVEDRAANLDYKLKRNAHRAEDAIDALPKL
jgi:ribosomal protein S18 acetylase RimI-like enzyme